MLSAERVNASYRDLHVLRDISFHVEEGEIVALVGANAAGKSTILKAIAGLISLDSGTILFDGKRIDRMPAHKIVESGISLIPEGRRLFYDLTVRENLDIGAFGRQVWGERESTLKEVYQIFPILEDRGNQLTRTLSGGEQQMVAVARGLMSRPRLCLFDEPCLGLSPLNLREIFRVIRKLRERGTTILIVEQNVRQTLSSADRVYVLENGRIVLQGTGQELIEHDHVRRSYLGL
jgi:branched-chain amino acid transport system ATP-binding protein